MARRKSSKPVELHSSEGTTFIDLGPSTGLETIRPADTDNFNFVLIHRHYDILFQKWGNVCGSIMSKIVERDADDKVLRWYHIKLYNFTMKQYDKYGDYYRMIDNTFGKAENDDIYEIR